MPEKTLLLEVAVMGRTKTAMIKSKLKIIETALVYLNLTDTAVITAPMIAATVVGIRLVNIIPITL